MAERNVEAYSNRSTFVTFTSFCLMVLGPCIWHLEPKTTNEKCHHSLCIYNSQGWTVKEICPIFRVNQSAVVEVLSNSKDPSGREIIEEEGTSADFPFYFCIFPTM